MTTVDNWTWMTDGESGKSILLGERDGRCGFLFDVPKPESKDLEAPERFPWKYEDLTAQLGWDSKSMSLNMCARELLRLHCFGRNLPCLPS